MTDKILVFAIATASYWLNQQVNSRKYEPLVKILVTTCTTSNKFKCVGYTVWAHGITNLKLAIPEWMGDIVSSYYDKLCESMHVATVEI